MKKEESDRDDLLGEFEFFCFLEIPYKEEYLKDDVSVSLIYPDEENRIEIWASIYLEDEAQLNLYFRYEYAEHKLIYVPIVIVVSEGAESTHYKESEEIYALLELYNLTKKEIGEYQRYVLYDVVVGTWVNANGGNLEKEEEKVRKCTLVDNTFNFDVQQ